MADFKVIETQEELERVLGERIGRIKDKAAKTEEGLQEEIASLKKQNADLNDKVTKLTEAETSHADIVAGLNAEISRYKLSAVKHQIANDNGLPYELAERLTGEDEESLRKDAEILKGFMQTKKEPPAFTPETPPEDTRQAELKGVLEKLQRR